MRLIKSKKESGIARRVKIAGKRMESPLVSRQRIINHLKVAKHFSLASKYYYHAATCREAGNCSEADEKVEKAIRHVAMANKCLISDLRYGNM